MGGLPSSKHTTAARCYNVRKSVRGGIGVDGER